MRVFKSSLEPLIMLGIIGITFDIPLFVRFGKFYFIQLGLNGITRFAGEVKYMDRIRPDLTADEYLIVMDIKIGDVTNDQLILDPGIAPIGSDSEGNFKRLMQSIKMIHEEKDFAGINMSVGLSNFTVMLPPKKADGSPVKGPLESAFLTMAMPFGFNMVIGSVKRKYAILPNDHPAMQCLKDILEMDGYDVIMRVMSYYS